MAEKLLLIHPDFPDLAGAKAVAASFGVDAQINEFVPQGKALLVSKPNKQLDSGSDVRP